MVYGHSVPQGHCVLNKHLGIFAQMSNMVRLRAVWNFETGNGRILTENEWNFIHGLLFSVWLPPGTACEFVVNTSTAGPGALAVTIDGPSKVKMDCVECPEGYRVTYTPMAPGNYLISIKYGGPYHIVGSPFKAKITGEERVRG